MRCDEDVRPHVPLPVLTRPRTLPPSTLLRKRTSFAHRNLGQVAGPCEAATTDFVALALHAENIAGFKSAREGKDFYPFVQFSYQWLGYLNRDGVTDILVTAASQQMKKDEMTKLIGVVNQQLNNTNEEGRFKVAAQCKASEEHSDAYCCTEQGYLPPDCLDEVSQRRLAFDPICNNGLTQSEVRFVYHKLD